MRVQLYRTVTHQESNHAPIREGLDSWMTPLRKYDTNSISPKLLDIFTG